MKSTIRLFCTAVVLFFALATAAFAQTANNVSKIEIRHVGPPAAADELILANIRTKVGDPFVRSKVDDDVKNLYATGFFYNIQVTEQVSDGGVTLTYILQGKPRLTSVKFVGNTKYSDGKLRKKVTSKPGDPLDEQKLFTDAQEIKKLYQKAGYAATEVKYNVSIDETEGIGTATFEITETPKVRISSLSFEGESAFSEGKLRKVSKIQKYRWLSWIVGGSKFKQDQLGEGKDRLADFYRENGYIDFEVKDTALTYPTLKRVDIRISLYEGNPYKVGNIEFEGNKLFPTEEVGKDLKMKEGDTFTPGGLSKNAESVEDFYGRRGYIDVNQSSGNLRVIRVPNTESNTMDLKFKVVEGQPSYVEKIEIRGNTKTKDKVIRRELAVSPGELFDMTRVKLSKSRLEGLQYFEKVEARPEPTDVPNRKNLVVDVEEKSTGNLTLGAGFSTVDALVGFVEVSQGNFDLFNPPTFTGGGQKFRIRVQFGTERQDYLISFIEPWFLGRKLALGVDLYRRVLNFQSEHDLYDETRTGGRLSLTRALGSDFLIGSVSYTFEQVGIDDVSYAVAPRSIANEAGNALISKLGASLAYDTRNNTTLPTRGQRSELLTEVATAPGDREFYTVELKTAWYFKGPLNGVLELVGRTGVADGLGGQDVPFYERYYLGGLYSLRGYDYRAVGPREFLADNSGTEPVGGNTYWFGTAEYSIPIIERLRFALFYDIGMVYPKSFSFSADSVADTGTYNDNWGVGLRLNLPIGPLRLDYGIPITHGRYSGSSGKFQFGVGYTREF